MSDAHHGPGRNDARPPIYSKEMLDEMKAFNAGLTQAGKKPRPARGRAPATVQRGRGSAVGKAHPPPRPALLPSTRAAAPGATRSGAPAGWGMMGPYTVGPSTSAPGFTATTPAQTGAVSPVASRGSRAPRTLPALPRSPARSGILVRSAPARAPSGVSGHGGFTGGSGDAGANSDRGRQHAGPQQSIGSMDGISGRGMKSAVHHPQTHPQSGGVLVSPMSGDQIYGVNDATDQPQLIQLQPTATGPGNQNAEGFTPAAPSAGQSQQPTGNWFDFQGAGSLVPGGPFQPARQPFNALADQPVPSPGRFSETTQQSSQDPGKPFIPAHLHQDSAVKAIEQIARSIGLAVSDISEDGRVLGFPSKSKMNGAAPRATAPQPSTVHTTSSTPVNPVAAATAAAACRPTYDHSSVDANLRMALAASGSKSAVKSQPSPVSSTPVPSHEMDVEMIDVVDIASKHDPAAVTFKGIADSRWATPSASAPQGTAPNGTFTSAFNENEKPFQAQQGTTSSYADIDRAILADLAKSRGNANPPVAQSGQNPFAPSFDPRSIGQSLAPDSAPAGLPSRGSAANVVGALQGQTQANRTFNGSPFVAQYGGWGAPVPDQVQANPPNLETAPATAVAAPVLPQPTGTSTPQAPENQPTTLFLSASRWAS